MGIWLLLCLKLLLIENLLSPAKPDVDAAHSSLVESMGIKVGELQVLSTCLQKVNCVESQNCSCFNFSTQGIFNH